MQATTDMGTAATEYVSNTVFADMDDDCWRDIFDCLSLGQQIPLLKVCPRFRNLIFRMWEPKFKNLHINFHENNDMTDAEFCSLLEYLCNSVEEVRLEFLPVTKYKVLKKFKFIKVHDLRFSQQTPFYMNDDDMLVLQKIFPNVRTFSPQGDFTGQYVTNWKQLEHLTLTYCSKANKLSSDEYFSQIFADLQLKSVKLDCYIFMFQLKGRALRNFCKLEKINLHLAEALWLLRDFRRFKHLKELIVTERGDIGNRNAIFGLINRDKPNDLLEMELANVDNSFIVSCLKEYDCYSNVYKLSFVNATPEVILPLESTDFWHRLPALRELHFYSGSLVSKDYILGLLQEGKQLERVTFEGCRCKFPTLKIDVSSIVDGRKKPLVFNFYQNFYDLSSNELNENRAVVRLNVMGSSDLLDVTCKRSKSINYEPFRFVFRQQMD